MRAFHAIRILATGGAVALLPLLSCGLGGCTAGNSGDRTQSDSARQDQALNDPMNYQVHPPTVDGTNDKQGLNRDLNDVFNP